MGLWKSEKLRDDAVFTSLWKSEKDYGDLDLPLKTSLSSRRGNITPTFSRSTAATVTDFEGIICTAKINELRFPGARRVQNILSSTETLSTQTVTVVLGASYILSFSGTGSVTLSGAATGTLSGSTGRVQITKTASTASLTLTVSGSVLQAQLERITGTQTAASEYVSSGVLSYPYHGAGADGVKYFLTDRFGNALSTDGAIIEPGATNLLSYSTKYESQYTYGNVEYVLDTNKSPDGGYNGRVYTFSSGVQTNYSIISVTPGAVYCFSQWVALGTAANAGYAIYNHTEGSWIVIAQYSGLTTALQIKKVTFTVPAGCTHIRLYPVRYVDSSHLGTVRLFGSQLELNDITSYIPTDGTPVTRTADILSYDVEDALTQGHGSLYCEFEWNTYYTYSYILSLDDGTSSNRIVLRFSPTNDLSIIVAKDSINIVSSLIGGSGSTLYKVLITYTENAVNLYVDGNLLVTDNLCDIPIGLTALNIGCSHVNTYQLNGSVKNIKYYKKVLSESEAIRMTS